MKNLALLVLSLWAPTTAHAGDRWITLGAAVSETMFALGVGDRVVGVDGSSVYPAAADALPEVGTLHHVNAERILALRPTEVFVAAEVGPPEALAQVRAAGVKVTILPNAATLDDVRTRIRTLATAGGVVTAGEGLITQLDQTLAAVPSSTTHPKVLFVYARGAGTLMLGGRGAGVDAIVSAAGGAFPADWDGFRPITAEALVALAPDVILLTTSGLESMGGKASFLAVPGVAMTPAGKSGRVVTIDDLLLLCMGPRTGDAVTQLHTLLFGTTR